MTPSENSIRLTLQKLYMSIWQAKKKKLAKRLLLFLMASSNSLKKYKKQVSSQSFNHHAFYPLGLKKETLTLGWTKLEESSVFNWKKTNREERLREAYGGLRLSVDQTVIGGQIFAQIPGACSQQQNLHIQLSGSWFRSLYNLWSIINLFLLKSTLKVLTINCLFSQDLVCDVVILECYLESE